MSDAKHTPGPWKVVAPKRPFHDFSHAIVTPTGAIAWTFPPHDEEAAASADAEFIARACNSHQTLLALCEEAAEILEADDRRTVCDLRARMLAAIAKAKG